MPQSNNSNTGYNAEILSDMVMTSLEYNTLLLGPAYVDGSDSSKRASEDRRPVEFKDFSADAKGQGHRKGDTVTWTRLGTFDPATDFNGTVNPRVLSNEQHQLEINYYKELSWEIALRTKIQRSFVDAENYAKAAANAWALTIERTIVPLFALFDLSIGDGTGNLSTDSFQEAWLESRRVGIDYKNKMHKAVALVTDNSYVSLKREGALSEYQIGGMAAVESWNSADIKQTPMGVPVLPMSPLTSSSLGSAGGTPYQAILTNEGICVGMAVRPSYVAKDEKIAANISTLSVMHGLWGTDIFRGEGGCYLNYTLNNGI